MTTFVLSTSMYPKWPENQVDRGIRLKCLCWGNSLKLMLQNLYCKEDTIMDTLEQWAFQGI